MWKPSGHPHPTERFQNNAESHVATHVANDIVFQINPSMRKKAIQKLGKQPHEIGKKLEYV